MFFVLLKKNPQLTQQLITKNNGIYFDTNITRHGKIDAEGFTAVKLQVTKQTAPTTAHMISWLRQR